MEKQQITICGNHEYKVPLLFTFVFPGAEYWCPYCESTFGSTMFGGCMGGEEVNVTETLIGRKSIYKEHSTLYLSARGLLVCSGTTIDEKKVDRKDIPAFVIACAKHYSKPGRWKHKIKASILLSQEPDDNDFEWIHKHGEMLYSEGHRHVRDPFIFDEWEKKNKESLKIKEKGMA